MHPLSLAVDDQKDQLLYSEVRQEEIFLKQSPNHANRAKKKKERKMDSGSDGLAKVRHHVPIRSLANRTATGVSARPSAVRVMIIR